MPERRQGAAVRLRQHGSVRRRPVRVGPDVEQLAARGEAKACEQRHRQRRQFPRVRQGQPVRLAPRAQRDQQRRNGRGHPADLRAAQAQRRPPAGQHRVVAGADMAQQRVSAGGAHRRRPAPRAPGVRVPVVQGSAVQGPAVRTHAFRAGGRCRPGRGDAPGPRRGGGSLGWPADMLGDPSIGARPVHIRWHGPFDTVHPRGAPFAAADDAPPARLSVAEGRSGGQGARGAGRGVPAAGQGRHRLRAAGLCPRHRRAVAQARGGGGRRPADRADRRLRAAARGLGRLRRAARRGVRAREAAHGAHRGAADLRAPARAVAALPSRPADRRADAGGGPRDAGGGDGAAARRVQHRADDPGGRDGHRDHLVEVRLALRGGHAGRGGGLHRLHARLHDVADQDPPRR